MQLIETVVTKNGDHLLSLELRGDLPTDRTVELFIFDENSTMVKKDAFSGPLYQIDMSSALKGWYSIELYYEGFAFFCNQFERK